MNAGLQECRNEEGVPGCCISDLGEGNDRENYQSGPGLPETQSRCNNQADRKKALR